MQDPSTAFQQMKPHFTEQEQLKCPRCDSTTKFCYYNNYNLSQPRHFCKNCRRYWTKGGALRNIPVGGGSRKNAKRSSNPKRANPDPNTNSDPARLNRRVPEPSSSLTPPTTAATSTSQFVANGISDLGDPTRLYGLEADQDRKILDMSGSFSSLLASNGQFGNIFEGLNPNGSGLKMVHMGKFGEDLNSGLNAGSGQNSGGPRCRTGLELPSRDNVISEQGPRRSESRQAPQWDRGKQGADGDKGVAKIGWGRMSGLNGTEVDKGFFNPTSDKKGIGVGVGRRSEQGPRRSESRQAPQWDRGRQGADGDKGVAKIGWGRMSGLNGTEVDKGFLNPTSDKKGVDPRDKCGLSCSSWYVSGEQHDESWQKAFWRMSVCGSE
ncbi:hypothetical protein GH714_031130 [Hevea brasiliensis]|uniref:Dof zinc finger protein n=1 Tax=Hevea brasiliensis TaxID=3981 RepID=A0A6A6LKK8_HEVBR|nr:hypothetical protein GH714_031130 [Hevea brasiliensis]